MAKTKAQAQEAAMDLLEQALDEFDLGVEFVAKEMATAKENQFAYAYAAGMAEEAVLQVLTLAPAQDRLHLAGELQAMVLQTAIELVAEG